MKSLDEFYTWVQSRPPEQITYKEIYDYLSTDKGTLEKVEAALEYYANWRNWDLPPGRTYDDSEWNVIKKDSEKMDYEEADGNTYRNSIGGKRAREALALLKAAKGDG